MDRLCDMVNEVLRSNQELSLRLRNMEQAQRAPVTTSTHDDWLSQSDSLSEAINTDEPTPDRIGVSSRSDSLPGYTAEFSHPREKDDPQHGATHAHVESTDHAEKQLHEEVRESAFEELLHQSRVYQHVNQNDDSPSLISDTRSSLALSICSSLTLGDISNVSLYAIPVYSREISNADCYTFGSLKAATTSTPVIRVPDDHEARTPTSWWRAKRKNSNGVDDRRIFGVALDTSIRYAYITISLFNVNSLSPIYGYTPIVLAACGVYLKEKGVYY